MTPAWAVNNNDDLNISLLKYLQYSISGSGSDGGRGGGIDGKWKILSIHVSPVFTLSISSISNRRYSAYILSAAY